MSVSNARIRKAAQEAGVYLWQIAEKLGINDGNFSRKLRRELPVDEQEKIMGIIRELSAKKQEAV